MQQGPKYRHIVDWALGELSAGRFKPGDRFLSEAALGHKFGFSRQTIRRALELLERDGYLTRMQGSGSYITDPGSWEKRPAAEAARGRSAIVGVLSTHLDDYIFPGIIRGIEKVLSDAGALVQLASTKELTGGEARALSQILEMKPDGLIVEPTKSGLPCLNMDLYRTIQQAHIPLVFIDSYYSEVTAPYVALDDEKAGYIAAEHLIAMGHRDIVGIFMHTTRQGQLRYLGYAKALRDYGLAVRDDRVHWLSRENVHELLGSQLLRASLEACTAAVCYNDEMAFSLMERLEQSGRHVPEDLSLISVDNSELARTASLTSVAHPLEHLGTAAAELLLSMMRGGAGETILFPPQLELRDSVRKWEG